MIFLFTIQGKRVSKIPTFTEDKEAAIFAKALLKSKATKLKFIDCSLPCSSLIDLPTRKVPSFVFPNALIFVDGDIRNTPKEMGKIRKLKNIVLLPSRESPERLLAKYLSELDDNSDVWQSINPDFNKAYCFGEIRYADMIGPNGRVKAKEWFKSHLKDWGQNAVKVINPWAAANRADADAFINEFVIAYNKFAKELSIKTL